MKNVNWRLIIASLLLGTLACCSGSQQPSDPFNLTKKQMYADFDEFVSIVKDVNPQLEVRYKLTGYNNLDSIIKIREQIKSVQSWYDYIELLNGALEQMHDIHAKMVQKPSGAVGAEYCDTSAIRQIAERHSKNFDSVYKNILVFFGKYMPTTLMYINGDYYSQGTWYIVEGEEEKRDTVHTVSYAKMLVLDGKPFNDYARAFISTYCPYTSYRLWDFERNILHANFLIERKGVLKVENYDGEVLELPTGDYTITSVLPDNRSWKALGAKRVKQTYPLLGVEYFDEQGVLYVYMHQMRDDEGVLPSLIKNAGKGRTIKKVIIDVRGNSGGDDNVWHGALKAIVKDSIEIKGVIATKNTQLIKKYMPDDLKSKMSERKIPLLDNETYLVSEDGFVLHPDDDGLKYDGKIYVLQNSSVYSSAQAFTAFAGRCERMVTVGERTGLLGGLGVAPWMFQLTHSKFTFFLEPVLDITGVQAIEDFYHDKPNIVISMSKDEIINRMDAYCLKINVKSKEYMLSKDSLFIKVLKME